MLRLHHCGYSNRHINGLAVERPAGIELFGYVYFRTPAQALENGQWLPAMNHYAVYEPGFPHGYRSNQAPYVDDWIAFTLEGEDDFFSRLGIPLNRLVPCNGQQWMGRTIQSLQDQQRQGGLWKDEIIDAELRAFFYRLAACRQASEADMVSLEYGKLLTALRNELYSTPRAGTSVGQLAEKAGLSKSYFQTVYKRCFGVSAGDDIIGGRLERARFLLESSNYPIGEVGRLSGYECDVHFLRQFKKFMGVTPGQYRRGALAGSEQR